MLIYMNITSFLAKYCFAEKGAFCSSHFLSNSSQLKVLERKMFANSQNDFSGFVMMVSYASYNNLPNTCSIGM